LVFRNKRKQTRTYLIKEKMRYVKKSIIIIIIIIINIKEKKRKRREI